MAKTFMNHLHFVYHFWKAWEGPLLHQKPNFFILCSSNYFIFFPQVWYKAKQNLSYEMTINIQSDTFLRVIYQYLYWQLPFHLLMKTLLREKRHTCEVVTSELLWRKFWLYIILPFLINRNFSVHFLLKVYHNSITLEKIYI